MRNPAILPAYCIGVFCYLAVLLLASYNILFRGIHAYWGLFILALVRVLYHVVGALENSILIETSAYSALGVVGGIASIVGTVLVILMVHVLLLRWLKSVCHSTHDTAPGYAGSITSTSSTSVTTVRRITWLLNGVLLLAFVFALVGFVGNVKLTRPSSISEGIQMIAVSDWGLLVVFLAPFYLSVRYRRLSRDWSQEILAGKAKKSQLHWLIVANSLLAVALLFSAVQSVVTESLAAHAYLGMLQALAESAGAMMLLWPGKYVQFGERMLLSNSLDPVHALDGTSMPGVMQPGHGYDDQAMKAYEFEYAADMHAADKLDNQYDQFSYADYEEIKRQLQTGSGLERAPHYSYATDDGYGGFHGSRGVHHATHTNNSNSQFGQPRQPAVRYAAGSPRSPPASRNQYDQRRIPQQRVHRQPGMP